MKIAFRIIEEGGIIIVHNSKFPAPFVESILKYNRYANTEHIIANKIEY